MKKSRVAGMAYFKTSPASILAGDGTLVAKQTVPLLLSSVLMPVWLLLLLIYPCMH